MSPLEVSLPEVCHAKLSGQSVNDEQKKWERILDDADLSMARGTDQRTIFYAPDPEVVRLEYRPRDRKRPPVSSKCLACGAAVWGTKAKRYCNATCRKRGERSRKSARNK